jgi:transposase
VRYVEGKTDREQVSFMPIAFDEMIDDDNAVGVIDAFVEMLDMKALDCKYSETGTTGRKPYSPKDMLKLYVYGYFNGIRTSRMSRGRG